MKSRVKIFMKKKLLIVCAVLICATWMAACGKDASEDARSGSGKENTEQERDEREDSTPETATESTVTENSTQDSAPVSNVISDVDISDYVYYSTAGDEFVAPKENAIEGIPYELTDEEKKILIPDSDVYVITADEVKDYEYIIEGEKITYFAAASCSFTDEGKYDKDCTIFFFEDDIIAAKSYDVLSASASDSVKYELDGRKVIQSRSISGCEWIDEYVSLCIDGGYSYIVACDSGRLTGDVRARAVALFDREDTVSVADSNDKPDDQIVVADTNDNSDPSLNGTQNGNGGDGTNATTVSEPSDESNGTEASSDESVKEDEEKASEYWYIGIRFRDTVGREFYFLEPDEKGNPTKITISGYEDEIINDGTFDFITELNMMSEPVDPWIRGRIIGLGNLDIKKELDDDQFRKIVVDIWSVEE